MTVATKQELRRKMFADVAATIAFYKSHRGEFPHGAQSTWRLVEDVLRRGQSGKVSARCPSTSLPSLHEWLIDCERTFMKFPAVKVSMVYRHLYDHRTVEEIAMEQRCSGYAVRNILDNLIPILHKRLQAIGFTYRERSRAA